MKPGETMPKFRRKPRTHIKSPKSKKRPKSSLAARRLIRAAIKQCGSQRKAAAALDLPTQAQVSKMLKGKLADTPAMRRAIDKAERRAWQAYYNLNGKRASDPLPDVSTEDLRRLNVVLADLLRSRMKPRR